MELLAPNGNPTNLTPEQYKLVRTPAFKKWFGDWENSPETSSKVVDENGEPMVVYHYSPNEFTIFDKNKHPQFVDVVENKKHKSLGYDFSTKEGFYQSKTRNKKYCVFLNLKNVFDFSKANEKDFQSIIKLLEKIPYYSNNKFQLDLDIKYLKNGDWGLLERPSLEKYFSKNYDGLFMKENDWLNVKVYNSNQIKLADGINVTFDGNNPDIRYADGGEVAERKETYKKWKSLVNMSKSELEKFYNSQEGKEAGLAASEAKEKGIDSGRESARWIMKMKDTPISEWTPNMWRWAKKQISFISRMSGNKGGLYDDKGRKTRKHTSLLIWGNNPKKKKFELGGTTIRKPKSSILLAPNGKPTNLTPEQYKLVRTPEFKAWFGDWENSPENSSKVVDENGEPLICYYGGRTNINVFDNKKSGSTRIGIFTTDSRKVAKHYTEFRTKYMLNPEDINKNGHPYLGNKSGIYDFFVNIKKPLVIDAKENNWSQIPTPKILKINAKTLDTDTIVEMAKKMKYDGVLFSNIYEEGGLSNDYVALNSVQIKLADGTNTTFNINNPDIRFDKGGKIDKVIWHGSDYDINKFDYNEITNRNETHLTNFWGYGIYFTNNKNQAKEYGKNLYSVVLSDDVDILKGKVKQSQLNKIWDGLIREGRIEKNIYDKEKKWFLNHKYSKWDIANDADEFHSYFLNNIKYKLKGSKDVSDFFLRCGIDGISFNNGIYVILNDKILDKFKKYYLNGGTTMRKPKKIDINKMPTFIAPNGERSNLYQKEEGKDGRWVYLYNIVRTPEFKAWFGDWEEAYITKDYDGVSKIIDENGEPNICYHVTSNEFFEFDENYIGSKTDGGYYGKGFYFTEGTPDSHYGEREMPCFLSIKNPFSYISTNRTYVLDSNELKEKGYDGVLVFPNYIDFEKIDLTKGLGYHGNRIEEIVAYYPEQIKLADTTNTTFDKYDNDIRFKDGGKTMRKPKIKSKDSNSKQTVYHGGHDIGSELILRTGYYGGKKTGVDSGAIFFTPSIKYANQYLKHKDGLYKYELEITDNIFDGTNENHYLRLKDGFIKNWQDEYSSVEDAISDYENAVNSIKSSLSYGAIDWATGSQFLEQISNSGFEGIKFLERPAENIETNSETGEYELSGNPVYSYALFKDEVKVDRFGNGGSIPDLLSSQEVEDKLGRELHWWNDDIVYISGIKYKKVYLRPEYKRVIE